MILQDPVSGPVRAVAFSSTGELAVSDRHTLGLGPPGGEPRWTDAHTGGGFQLAFTPDGRRLLTEGNLVHGLHAWDTATGVGGLLVKPAASNCLLAAGPDGRAVVVSHDMYGDRTRYVQWYDFTAGGWTHEQANAEQVWPLAVALRPDGAHLAITNEWVIQIWDTDRRRMWPTPREKPTGINPRLLYTPAGRLLCADGRQVVAYDGRYKPAAWLVPGRGHITGMAVHPSGRWLAVTCGDPAVRLYDTSTWKLTSTLTLAAGKLRCVAFSPDGLLAAAGGDRVAVWDMDA